MDKREHIINVINSPLGFFALSLLIIEGFLGIVVIGSGSTLNSNAKLYGMQIAAAAFFFVVIIVALMVWLIPERLMLRGKDWRDRLKKSESWADDSEPKTKERLEQVKEKETS